MAINHLRVAQGWADLLDNKFSIGRFGFGLDPLLNFIPVAGPIASFGLSAYIWWIATDLQVPTEIHTKILRNLVIDFVIGLIPFVGWASDFFFKANIRNLKLVQDWIDSQPIDGQVISSRKIA